MWQIMRFSLKSSKWLSISLSKTGITYHSKSTGQCRSFQTVYLGFQVHPLTVLSASFLKCVVSSNTESSVHLLAHCTIFLLSWPVREVYCHTFRKHLLQCGAIPLLTGLEAVLLDKYWFHIYTRKKPTKQTNKIPQNKTKIPQNHKQQ